jgi:nucleotide-binding universal stress UspA family protein
VRQLLVPIDFSPCSDAASTYAELFALAWGATIDLLHVWQPPSMLPPGLLVISPVAAAAGVTLEDLVRTRVDKELHARRAALASRGIEARIRLSVGHPAQEILELARLERFDLIILGTHGRTALSHLFLGGVTEKVMRHLPCPVLTVRAP